MPMSASGHHTQRRATCSAARSLAVASALFRSVARPPSIAASSPFFALCHASMAVASSICWRSLIACRHCFARCTTASASVATATELKPTNSESADTPRSAATSSAVSSAPSSRACVAAAKMRPLAVTAAWSDTLSEAA